MTKILVTDVDAPLRAHFDAGLQGHEIVYTDERISLELLQAHVDTEVLSVFVSSAVTKECIDALPHLRLIVARSTGVDHIDVSYAKSKGISVVNVAKYGAHTVAEFTFALLLNLSRRLYDAAVQVKEDGNFNIASLNGFDLFGKTLGVIGTGAIGRNVVRIAQGFGMTVRMFDTFPDLSIETESAKYASIDELVAASDIITLHVPYTPENHHLVSAETIAKMKQGVYIINTARGELIDTEALLAALESGHVGGAGLDVLEGERSLKDEMDIVRGSQSIHELKAIIRDHVLVRLPRVIITPHIAFFSDEAYGEILQTSIDNINAFLSGTPKNVI
ncbi:hydroxyacid dehydrogenase [Candidatus Kaiserbacteria bacterium]|nr:hydroxyacid dehydrogenase [Candidatus Kaiserbacteria bacterium]